jgi:hypothetical protein
MTGSNGEAVVQATSPTQLEAWRRACDRAAAATLVEELLAFQVRVTAAANETFGAWREGRHDDLVLAVAVAAWAGEHLAPPRFEVWV